jgi:hypothetical protein
LSQEHDFTKTDLPVKNTDTEFIADGGAVYVEDMLESSALEPDYRGVDEVVLEEENEVHGRTALKFKYPSLDGRGLGRVIYPACVTTTPT